MTQLYKLHVEKNVKREQLNDEIEHVNDEKEQVNNEIEQDKLAQKFAIGVYDESREFLPKDWKLISEYSNNDNGFHGEAYEKDGKIIIAFRGTQWYSLGDLNTDVQMIRKEIPKQANSALTFYYKVEKYCVTHDIDKSNITITGHSLGGSLGEFVGPTVKVKTVTFNAYGVKDIAERNMILKGENENYVKNYGDVNDRTFYTKMHNHVGKTYVLDNDKDNKVLRNKKYHKAETIQNLEDAEPYDIHKHHKFEKESMHKDRVLVVEEVRKRKNKERNDAFSKYFRQQAQKGYTMWEQDINKKVSGGEVYVHSYTRDDGTYVTDYYRSSPNR